MNIKKIVATLFVINILQLIFGVAIWIAVGNAMAGKIPGFVYLSIGMLLVSTFTTIIGLYFAGRYKNDSLEESLRQLEELNTTLRVQRHDYLNHFQVIYGLMELGEYTEAKKYLEPVFKDILKISKALKTSKPAVNALLQAKMEVAEKRDINMFLEVRSDLKNLRIEAWNLCKILANIIDNSITAVSGMDKEKCIHVEIGEDQISYKFMIWNNGPWIPEELVNEIFKQGFTTKQEKDHGMGLYIVSKILREESGTIQVSSTEEKTSFLVVLPKTHEE